MVETRTWQSIEPVTSWKNPDSIQMSIVAYFFQLSHYLKVQTFVINLYVILNVSMFQNLNTYIHNEFNVPVWAVYALFAVATIFIGAVIGLLFVCVADFFIPQKQTRYYYKPQSPDFVDLSDEEENNADSMNEPESETPAENDPESGT